MQIVTGWRMNEKMEMFMNHQREMTFIDIKEFNLPAYGDIPDVGLFLEQTTKYVSEYLKPLQGVSVTGSMISNYVKKKMIDNPVKKQYFREQIADIFFIAVTKSVLSLEDIQLLIELQKKTYDCETAYEYFRLELKNVLFYVCGLKEELEKVGQEQTSEKILLRNTIMTVAHKVYLDKYLLTVRNKP